jgi:dTDP-4-amino-4,6-dideoxygalactose transaminase
MIPVTKPFLPPIEEYNAYVAGIYKRNWLTNNGPLVNELELKLKEYLQVPHLLYLSNGTIAIQIAIRALELTGEIITTPFSYVATTSSAVWEGLTPVFVDIDPDTFNIDPAKIEAAITPDTSAILATHVYGNPCDIDAIERIAKKHHLKVIYDAAHCFGTLYKGKSVFHYGDISTTSFHATKLYHTIEGGAVFTSDPALLKKMSYLRNFGHAGPEEFASVGINGKNSEFHAAMGLTNLRYINDILASRKSQYLHYQKALQNIDHVELKLQADSDFNYAYYPLILHDETTLLKVKTELEKHWIYPRRYFYPSLNKVPYVKPQSMPISEDVSTRVMCLPMFHQLTDEEINFIDRIIARTMHN